MDKMKRIFFFVLVILVVVVFSLISINPTVSNRVMKVFVTSKSLPTASTFVEILKLKSSDHQPSIPPVLEDLQNRLPNLPVLSWLEMRNKASECSTYPDILDIEYSNKYWQLYRSENAMFYLYSAILGKYNIYTYISLYLSNTNVIDFYSER